MCPAYLSHELSYIIFGAVICKSRAIKIADYVLACAGSIYILKAEHIALFMVAETIFRKRCTAASSRRRRPVSPRDSAQSLLPTKICQSDNFIPDEGSQQVESISAIAKHSGA